LPPPYPSCVNIQEIERDREGFFSLCMERQKPNLGLYFFQPWPSWACSRTEPWSSAKHSLLHVRRWSRSWKLDRQNSVKLDYIGTHPYLLHLSSFFCIQEQCPEWKVQIQYWFVIGLQNSSNKQGSKNSEGGKGNSRI
jgi:hypothetical protein